MRVPVMAGALLAFAALGGCTGSGQPTGAPTAAPTPAPTSAATSAATAAPTAAPTPAPTQSPPQAIECNAAGSGSAVEIRNFAFTPGSITVAVNGQVTWANADSVTHTVTFVGGPECGRLSGGATAGAMFTVAGTYPYHCAIHPDMEGEVIVE